MAETNGQLTRVLVADDAAIIRLVVGQLLAGCGCRVVAEASTGRGAVEAYEEHRPDVTLLDLNMPDGDGASAAASIREIAPGAPIILASVFVADTRLQSWEGVSQVQVLEKPFAAETVRDALARVAA
jgi:two-component system chemotaxis response regulator CheY